MSTELPQAQKAVVSMDLHIGVSVGPARQCVVIDRGGKRMVLPRYSAADAIEQIAIAVAGRTASPEEKRNAWQHLRDQHGYSVQWLQPRLAGSLQPSAR